MIFVGVDPGKHGAIAATETGSATYVWPVPVINASRGKGRVEYDLVGIRVLFNALRDSDELFVTVEKSQPLPPKMGGTIANYHRGTARGWEWLFVALRIPYQMAAPISWMRIMHAGTPGQDSKQKSILAAQRLFPNVGLKRSNRSRVDDHNFAEALLLAEFGRRTHQHFHYERAGVTDARL